MLYAQVEPAFASSLATARGIVPSSSSGVKSHDGFVSLSSARSSRSSHHVDSLPLNNNNNPAVPESSGQLPTSPAAEERQTQSRPGSQSQSEGGTVANSNDCQSPLQPDVSGPFQRSLDALHADQQQPEQQAASSDQSEEAAASADQQPTIADSQPQRSPQLQAPAQTPFQTAQIQSSKAASSAAAGATAGREAGSDTVNASPVGSASTDAWEMVQDANNIYNWKAGSLFGRSLSSHVRQGSECSEEGESYSQCKQRCMSASWLCLCAACTV